MSSLHPARRSAERFNSLLESEQGDTRDPRDADLLELVGALQSVSRAEARPAFVSDLRERLMLAAEAELVVPDSPAALDARLTVRSRRTPRERRLAMALGGIAIVGATTSMAVAAQSALPGDVLYPLKRAMENAEAGFSVSDDAKGSTMLDNASGRLDEVDALTQQDDVDEAAVTQALNTFTEQATEASELLTADYEATGSEDSINELRDFAASSIGILAVLNDVIPDGAEPALLAAAQVLFEIDSLAANLCPVCESLGITEIPVPLLASGDTQLDDAAVDAAVDAAEQAANQPDQGNKPDKGDKGPATTDPGTQTGGTQTTPTGPLQLPTQGTNGNNGNNGNGNGQNNNPQNPLGTSVSIPTAVPSVGIPEVDQVVEDVVEGVNGVLGGLTGAGN